MRTEPIHKEPILKQLKRHGQMLDSEIAIATGIPLKQVRTTLEEMTAKGVLTGCHVIRYQGDTPVQSMQCRISGYIPPAAPGRKPGS